MAYAVKELFYTIQGEGFHTGRPAVFLRFAGCNLWSGREADRPAAACRFCDTDFVGLDGPGGGRFVDARELARAAARAWHGPKADTNGRGVVRPFVVCTGGEPLLQLDGELIAALHAEGFEVAVETNGTIAPPDGIDWLCVSPKAGAQLAATAGHELKLVYPQDGAEPGRFADLEFGFFFLQPLDGPDAEANTCAALEYCLAHPRWRLSLQTQKLIGLQTRDADAPVYHEHV